MKIGILISAETEFDFITNSLTNVQLVEDEQTFEGKIYSKDVVVAKVNNDADVPILIDTLNEKYNVSFIVSLGTGEALSPYLRMGDFIIETETSSLYDGRFVDNLLSVDFIDNEVPIRILAGKILAHKDCNTTNVCCYAPDANIYQNICEEKGVPLVTIRRIIVDEVVELDEKELVQSFLWVLKKAIEKQ